MTVTEQRTILEFVKALEELTKDIQTLYRQDETPWVIGYSGGKDSTCITQLIWYAIAALPVEQRHKTIYVMSNDTLVENPIVSLWVRKSLERINEAAAAQNMPVEAHLNTPDVKETFWVCLIGKGYQAPTTRFRWCTERMKINPADAFIRKTVSRHGSAILVLGTRKAESTVRGARMEELERKHRLQDKLNAIAGKPNTLAFSPIEDWRTDEVWIYLNQWENPWGHSNKDLFVMYRGATADNECPLVVDTNTQSCGSSRFGCWVCTVVDRDKSMEAMILNDEEKEWMQPMLDIRNELDLDEKEDRHRRDFRRMYGAVELFEQKQPDGSTLVVNKKGPYLRYWRERWLRMVLEAQTYARRHGPEEVKDLELITMDELREIRRIWMEEKHEFNDTLPVIYQEATGQPFKLSSGQLDKPLLDQEVWDVLEEVCAGDPIELELMARLYNTEHQHLTKKKRTGIYQDLEKCFDFASRDLEESLEFAQYKHNIKDAIASVGESDSDSADRLQAVIDALKADPKVPAKPEPTEKRIKAEVVEQIMKTTKPAKPEQPKQLTWGDVKFTQAP